MLRVEFAADNLCQLKDLIDSFSREVPVVNGVNQIEPIDEPGKDLSSQEMLELINIALGEQGLRAVIVPLETAEPAPEPEKAKAKTKTKAVPKTEPAPAQSAEPSTIQDVEPQGTLTPPAKAPDKDTEETPEELYKKALDLLIRIHRGGGDGVSEKLEALKKTYGVTKFSLIDKDKGGELFKDAVKLAVDINFQG